MQNGCSLQVRISGCLSQNFWFLVAQVRISGCKMVAPSKSEFLFQYTLLHVKFDSYEQFLPPNIDDVPHVLQCYVITVHNQPEVWNNDDTISSLCRMRGFQNHKTLTFLSFVHFLADTYNQWHTNSINADNRSFSSSVKNIQHDLNEQ